VPFFSGTDDVMRLVDVLERADVDWCVIDGVAVNHWAERPLVTQDVDLVVASDAVERTVVLLEQAGFHSERFPLRKQAQTAVLLMMCLHCGHALAHSTTGNQVAECWLQARPSCTWFSLSVGRSVLNVLSRLTRHPGGPIFAPCRCSGT
jgi:hypothetical protein